MIIKTSQFKEMRKTYTNIQLLTLGTKLFAALIINHLYI